MREGKRERQREKENPRPEEVKFGMAAFLSQPSDAAFSGFWLSALFRVVAMELQAHMPEAWGET